MIIKIMKKYLFGVFAIALAVGFSSFVNKTTVRFEYQLDTYLQSEVEDVANYIQESSKTCGAVDKACMIEVDPANLLNGQLDPSKVQIEASDFNSNGAFAIEDVHATGTPAWSNQQ